MHCSANIGPRRRRGPVLRPVGHRARRRSPPTPARRLIGDDEHGWADDGVFNIEGGCYAKCINLSRRAASRRSGARSASARVLENVVRGPGHAASPTIDDGSHDREHPGGLPGRVHPQRGHPRAAAGTRSTIFFLTSDAFGVLPPIARLTPDQAMYHFLSGYTPRWPAPSAGVTEPEATFRTCFGAPFLPLPPDRYARAAGRQASTRTAPACGWSTPAGPAAPTASAGACSIAHTRAMVTAAINGRLDEGAPGAPTRSSASRCPRPAPACPPRC